MASQVLAFPKQRFCRFCQRYSPRSGSPRQKSTQRGRHAVGAAATASPATACDRTVRDRTNWPDSATARTSLALQSKVAQFVKRSEMMRELHDEDSHGRAGEVRLDAVVDLRARMDPVVAYGAHE